MTTTKPEFDYDVFISYSSKDKEWVRGELLPRIEATGLRAFIDFRDFTRGAPSIQECVRGVVECRKTLVIITPNYLKSSWAAFENLLHQTDDPINEKLRLIPVLRERCELPKRIGLLTYINYTDEADLDLAWRQLLTALGAPPEPEEPKEPQRADWFLAHPYPMPPNFTGRKDERKMLTEWLSGDDEHPLLSLRALGGFGKSALAWHWLMNDVDPSNWQRVVWWSFYESDASFDSLVAQTLDYLSDGQIKPARATADDVVTLLKMLHHPGTLLVLDGFERELRAFGGLNAAYQGDDAEEEDSDRDCISPLAETFLRYVATLPGLRSKVLLTTRLCPRIVEARGGGLLQGCRDKELEQMQPADAVGYFWARGVRGTRVEIEAVCAPYGYHPLSLCLLAGLIVGDFELPGDMAIAQGLDVSSDLRGQQHHVLEVAYDSLTAERRALLSRIAAFRSPMDYEALKALAETVTKSSTILDVDLKDLVARGLLHHDTSKGLHRDTQQGRFDLHPIVRRYAYDRLAVPDRDATHVQLRDYFAAVPPEDNVTCLEDLTPVIELYHHTVRAGQYEAAFDLYRDRLGDAIYYQLGVYQLQIDLLRGLFPVGDDRLPRLKSEDAQAWTLNDLANSYSLAGQPHRAVPLYVQQIAIREGQGDAGRSNLATGLGNLAFMAQIYIGVLRDAEANLRRAIVLGQEIENERTGAVGRQELGRVLAYRGAYAESEMELEAALQIKVWRENPQGHGINWSYRAHSALLLLRSNPYSTDSTPQSALNSAQRTLELADETARTLYPHERDYVSAHWLLGAAHRTAGQHDQAERHLLEALKRCRSINLVEHEANILIDLARLRAATGKPDEAKRLAEEALLITERCGYVLQGADAHLELAKLAIADSDTTTAKDHAQQAKDLATCDGPPDYTYKAAYDEACALLDEMK